MEKQMTILLATHNQHKVDEINSILDSQKFEIISLSDINYTEEIIEDGNTMAENAMIKAKSLKNLHNGIIVGEDSGLEIESLDNMPGIYTARFAGPNKDATANMEKVLQLLKGNNNRKAQFRTVIALIHNNKEYFIEGIVEGRISLAMKGENGFGYDPIFIPSGYHQTFAELGDEIKNSLSHRYNATKKLQEFLESTRELNK